MSRGSGLQVAADWEDLFIDGRWYEFIMTSYNDDDTWADYKGISEKGSIIEFSNAELKAVFYYTPEELRDVKIDEIIGGKNV